MMMSSRCYPGTMILAVLAEVLDLGLLASPIVLACVPIAGVRRDSRPVADG